MVHYPKNYIYFLYYVYTIIAILHLFKKRTHCAFYPFIVVTNVVERPRENLGPVITQHCKPWFPH